MKELGNKEKSGEEESEVTREHLDEYNSAGVDLAIYVDQLVKKYHLTSQEMRDLLGDLENEYHGKWSREKK